MSLAELDLTATEATELVDSIKRHVGVVWRNVERAYLGRAWLALGFDSWDDMCDAEFDARIPLPREQRQEVVGSLRDAGMSTRAIASALGVNDKTVRNDLAGAEKSAPGSVLGADGKTYPATKPAAVTVTERDSHSITTSTPVPEGVNPLTGEIAEPGPALYDRAAEAAWEDECHPPKPEPEPAEDVIVPAPVMPGPSDSERVIGAIASTRNRLLNTFPPESLGPLDGDVVEAAESLARSVTTWATALREANPRNLRAIQGGRS